MTTAKNFKRNGVDNMMSMGCIICTTLVGATLFQFQMATAYVLHNAHRPPLFSHHPSSSTPEYIFKLISSSSSVYTTFPSIAAAAVKPTRYHTAQQAMILGMSPLGQDSTTSAEYEMEYERAGTAAPLRPTKSAVPNRDGQKKHMGARKKKNKSRKKVAAGRGAAGGGSSKSVSTKELVDHVSGIYNEGMIKQNVRKRRNKSARAALDSRTKKARKNNDHATPTPCSEHVQYIRRLDSHPALVLNADYQPMSHLPLSLWSWQDTVKAVFSGKVTVVETYPDVYIRAVNLDMPLPSVIALNEYISLASKQKPAFTRRNVFLRDAYTCQYCSNRFRTGDLSLDHVVPRSRGGRLCWDNAVTSCRSCNGRKGSLMPQQLKSVGMKLLRQPRIPTIYDLNAQASQMIPRRKVHPSWKPFLLNQEQSA